MMRWATESGAIDDDLAQHDWTGMFDLLIGGKLKPADIQRAIDQFVAFLGTRTKAEIQQPRPCGQVADRSRLDDRRPRRRSATHRPRLLGRGRRHDPPGPLREAVGHADPLRRSAPSLGQDQAPRGRRRSSPVGPGACLRAAAPRPLRGAQGRRLRLGGGPAARVQGSRQSRRHGPQGRVGEARRSAPHPAAVEGRDARHRVGLLRRQLQPVEARRGTRSASAEGREVALRLVDWADVVIESFTPGTAKRLGLDYETLLQAQARARS